MEGGSQAQDHGQAIFAKIWYSVSSAFATGCSTNCPSKLSDVRLIKSNKGSKERQGQTLGVCFIEVYKEVSNKTESTVKLKGIFLIHECYRL